MPFFSGVVDKPKTTIKTISSSIKNVQQQRGAGLHGIQSSGGNGNNTNTSVDLDKLYHAVAVAESGNCSTAWHKKANNCVSIMSWKGGKRHLRSFSSIDDSKAYFKQLWVRAYGNRLPTLKDAIKYTGNDKAYGWRNTVISVYNASK